MRRYQIWIAAALVGILSAAAATADHGWGPQPYFYHWARSAVPFTLQVTDSVTPLWDRELEDALAAWNGAAVVVNSITAADDAGKTRNRCQSITGKIRVCNNRYGFNGWAGLASINIQQVGGHYHIVKGVAKMNDSYGPYSQDFMNHVMCQEIGHLYGLGHTSEDGSSQKSCMDYSSDTDSQWPNAHDLDMLRNIYLHLDSYDSAAAVTSGSSDPAPCRGNKCSQFEEPELPPMGVRVHHNDHLEIWVARGREDSLWIHHVTLVPAEFRR